MKEDIKKVVLVVALVAFSVTLFYMFSGSSNDLTGGAVVQESFIEDQVSSTEAYAIAQELGISATKKELEDPYLSIKIKNIQEARQEHDAWTISKISEEDVVIPEAVYDSSKNKGRVGSLSDHTPLLSMISGPLPPNISAAIVDYNENPKQVYFDETWTYSYADGTVANPNLFLKLCADSQTELLNNYVSIGYQVGEYNYLYASLFGLKINANEIDANNCTLQDLDFSSSRSFYPGILSVALSVDSSFSSPTWYYLNETTGFMNGSYIYTGSQNLTNFNVNITEVLDDQGQTILTDWNRLFLGLGGMPDGTFSLNIDSYNVTSPNDAIDLEVIGSPDYLFINGIPYGGLSLQSYVSDCGVLESGENLLADSVAANGTCFTIGGDGVSLDCGYNDIYYAMTEQGYAIDNQYGFENLTVQNCNIYEGVSP